LKQLTIIVDVGGEYDPARKRFDHHQKGFEETFDVTHKIKLSSAGLIYKHFGVEVISRILNLHDKKQLDVLYQKVYENLIEGMDALDNGIDQYPPECIPKYRVMTDLGSRVSRLNPLWNDPQQDYQGAFKKAMEITGEEFLSFVNYFGQSWLPAREIVAKSLAYRFGSQKEIIVLEKVCPWKDHLLELESLHKIEPQIKYVLYEDTSTKDNTNWRVQAVPTSTGSFQSRKPLPIAWRGLRDHKLSEQCGIDSCIFVHSSGFIGGNQTKEGALKMAEKALEIS